MPMFNRTPAWEAVTAPTNTARISSVFFIHKVRRAEAPLSSIDRRFFARFSLNKPVLRPRLTATSNFAKEIVAFSHCTSTART